ncbi:hypothetical protein BpHYR1_004089 [Brachionus plicatilis]|uniref:Uncharacterized protein n=1 Tax=Brachionus plicatilis TaxID=10195 RepID=A0A3M7RN37_BRAPC|nr:hypothetical protein BpHYR1_004089 [Brachionus plicatilis]
MAWEIHRPDIQLCQLEDLSLGVGYFAFNCASVCFLNWPEDNFVHFVTFFSATETVVECVRDRGAIANDAPRSRI